MAAVIAFDRRADHYVENKPRALDAWDDVDALAAESRGHLERAHTAKWTNDESGFLTAVTRINERLVAIRHIARDRKGAIESAPVVDKAQLAFWERQDGAVVEFGGQTAA